MLLVAFIFMKLVFHIYEVNKQCYFVEGNAVLLDTEGQFGSDTVCIGK